MQLTDRDRQIVLLVGRFKQVSSAHVRELLFATRKSNTPCDRTLKRLTERRYLARIERRNVGGSRGGSGQYVYQLGPHGHTLLRQGRYIPMRSINYHTLAIADTYLQLHRLQASGNISIRGVSNEPDCWMTIDRYELKPDMYVELEHQSRPGDGLKIWFEIDMGSEGQRQIKAKLERYWNAYGAAEDAGWDTYPLVMFAAIDEYRARELRWLIEQGPAEARALFRVVTIEELSTAFV